MGNLTTGWYITDNEYRAGIFLSVATATAAHFRLAQSLRHHFGDGGNSSHCGGYMDMESCDFTCPAFMANSDAFGCCRHSVGTVQHVLAGRMGFILGRLGMLHYAATNLSNKEGADLAPTPAR